MRHVDHLGTRVHARHRKPGMTIGEADRFLGEAASDIEQRAARCDGWFAPRAQLPHGRPRRGCVHRVEQAFVAVRVVDVVVERRAGVGRHRAELDLVVGMRLAASLGGR